MENLRYEKELWSRGIKHIAGVDEVGRGPLAGPLVAATVILDLEKLLNPKKYDVSYLSLVSEIKDSKLLTPKKRDVLAKFIKDVSIAVAVSEIDNQTIDQMGISACNALAFTTVVKNLKVKPGHILTDFFKIPKIGPHEQTNIVGGDRNSISIAAASIIAKVHRDAFMTKMHCIYPSYYFDQNKGYGTKQHIVALNKLGPCKIHRMTFAPVKSLLVNMR